MNKNFKDDVRYRMSQWKKVICKRCGKGYYITDEKDIINAKYIYCNKCDSWIEFLPANLIVE